MAHPNCAVRIKYIRFQIFNMKSVKYLTNFYTGDMLQCNFGYIGLNEICY